MPTIVMLTSLFKNNIKNIDVYILYSDLKDSEINKLKNLVDTISGGKGDIIPIKLENDLFNDFSNICNYPKEAYYRLLAIDVLPQTLNRILYLDSDIIVNGSLQKYYNQNLGDYYAAACEDCILKYDVIAKKKDCKRLNIPINTKYFNSGQMLLNLKLLRRNFDTNYIFKYITENKDKIVCADQDVLNVLFINKIKLCNPIIYNLMSGVTKTKKQVKIACTKSVIIHFAGPNKPWNYTNFGSKGLQNLFWEYANRTGYRYMFPKFIIKNTIVRILYTGYNFMILLIPHKLKDTVKQMCKNVLLKL